MSQPGAVVTDRDKQLLCYLALARCLTRQQILALTGYNRAEQNVDRRIRRLSARGPGIQPYLEAIDFHRERGTPVPLWTLTERGWTEAVTALPDAMPRRSQDLSNNFLSHTIQLNRVLVELILSLRETPDAPARDLPFRWLPESKDQLAFKVYDEKSGLVLPTAIKPDAVLEAPAAGRRVFIEAETGTQNITTATPFLLKAGAISKKVLRYATYFAALAEKGQADTWYTRAYPDKLFPELLIVVHSAPRKERVEWLVKRRVAKMPQPHPFQVRVLTFDEAAVVLAHIIRKETPPGSRVLSVPEATGVKIRDGYNTVLKTLNTVLQAVSVHNQKHPSHAIPLPHIPRETILGLGDLIKNDLLADSRQRPRWARHLVEETSAITTHTSKATG